MSEEQSEILRLTERVRVLEIALERANERASGNWDALEDVCCGTKLECPICGGLKPCCCDK